MSRNYKINNPEAAYFVSFAVAKWLGLTVDYSGEKGLIDNVIVVREL
jgi:hypothetical protein